MGRGIEVLRHVQLARSKLERLTAARPKLNGWSCSYVFLASVSGLQEVAFLNLAFRFHPVPARYLAVHPFPTQHHCTS